MRACDRECVRAFLRSFLSFSNESHVSREDGTMGRMWYVGPGGTPADSLTIHFSKTGPLTPCNRTNVRTQNIIYNL